MSKSVAALWSEDGYLDWTFHELALSAAESGGRKRTWAVRQLRRSVARSAKRLSKFEAEKVEKEGRCNDRRPPPPPRCQVPHLPSFRFLGPNLGNRKKIARCYDRARLSLSSAEGASSLAGARNDHELSPRLGPPIRPSVKRGPRGDRRTQTDTVAVS